MRDRGKKVLAVCLAMLLVMACLPVLHKAAAEGRATFDRGTTVRDVWISLAGGKNNVKVIRQYPGASMPEGVTARTVSSSGSQVPIYSWFEDGTIYYWSEDPRPRTNADASFMFYSFSEAEFIDAAPFDTSGTTDMEGMFGDCDSLETLDVSGFDTTNVRCMYCMFIYCGKLKEIDVSHFNTTNTTSMSDSGYGSLCGMFLGCSSVKVLDLSSFDMTRTSWTYHTQNMFPGCTSLEKLILGPQNRFNRFTSLSGSWTHEGDGVTLSGSALTSQYDSKNAFSYSGTWLRNMPEGHYYRTDGSLGGTNLWEVHTPDDRFKGYCLNLNKFGVAEELDRVLAEDDAAILELLCTQSEGSVHGSSLLGANMREALITLIYYGWPNDAAGIQAKYGLSDQEYMEITQNAVWDFTDRYDEPAGPSLYEGNSLAAYNALVSQRYANIEGKYILFLYKSWDPSKQNLLSIMGVDDQEYGGVSVRKQNKDGSENLAGAVFTVYDEEGTEVGTMTTSADGVAFICRTDHTAGLPLGKYTVRETEPPAGYYLSDVEYHFEITEANEIVTTGWRMDPVSGTIEEEMIFYNDHDDTYSGGGIGIIKKSDTGKMLGGATFRIYDAEGTEVASLVTNDSGVAATGKQDLPLGTYTVKETDAPEGHMIMEGERTVEITQNFQFLTLTFENREKTGSVTLEAQKILEGEGAKLEEGQFTFQLLDERYNVIQEASNDASGRVVFNTISYTPDDLGYKNYHIIEVIGDDDTIRYDRHQEDVTVTIYDTGTSLDCTAIYDSNGAVFTNTTDAERFEIQVLKRKLNTDEAVEGAVLEVRDASGRLVENWVTDSEPHTLKLDPGQYVLREMTAPRGYYEFEDIRFEVAEDGKLTSGSDAAVISGSEMTVWDEAIPSTQLPIRKTDAETGAVLENAEFTLEGQNGSSYHAVETTGADGSAVFTGLETGTYTLTESAAPEGYQAQGGPWTVEVIYNKGISKTGNINTHGASAGEYSNAQVNETVTCPGAETIHVELRYQTEDGYDYLLLLDKDGKVITQDKNGSAIGDTRASYRGYIWGGLDSGQIRTLSFDLEGDTVTFRFIPDANLGGYGYYAVVTAESRISVTDASGERVDPEDGVYSFENRKIRGTELQFSGTKTMTGRELQEGEFRFTLTGSDGTQETVTNDAQGRFAFSRIVYEESGTFTYEVKEEPCDDPEVVCDPTVYQITVKVTQKEDGSLEAEVIGADPEALDFTNTCLSGSLKIMKTVNGDLADRDRAFTFQVQLSAEGTFNCTGDWTGTIQNGGTLKLKHGQSVTITGLPEGCTFKVTELDGAGYQVSAGGDSGTIKDDTVSVASFVNTKNSVPDTGDSSRVIALSATAVCAVLGMTGLVLFRRKRNGAFS